MQVSARRDRKDILMQQSENADMMSQAVNEQARHPLMTSISEKTKFFIYRLPNIDCLNHSLIHNEIPLQENSSTALSEAFDCAEEDASKSNIILLVSIFGKHQFSGVCKITSNDLT